MTTLRALRRVFKVLFVAVEVLVLTIAAALVAAVLVANTPAARRALSARVTTLLAPVFKGRLLIERIDGIGLAGVQGVQVRLRDPEGRQVLFASGVRAHVDLFSLVDSAILGHGDLRILLSHASITEADVSLDTTEDGKLRLVEAFGPRKAPAPARPGERPSRGVRLTLSDARLAHGWIHGQLLPNLPRLDADLTDIDGNVIVSSGQVRVDMDRGHIVARGMPRGANPRGAVSGAFRLPSTTGEGVGLDARLDGSVAGARVSANASLDGQHLRAHADVLADPKVLALLVPEVKVAIPVTASVSGEGDLPHLDVRSEVHLGESRANIRGSIDLGPPVRARAEVAASRVDLRAFDPSLPSSELGMHGSGSVTFGADGAPRGPFRLTVAPGRIGSENLPETVLDGRFEGSTVEAMGAIDEPGAPALAALTFRPSVPGGALDVEASTSISSLARVPRLRSIVDGTARVEARARLYLRRGTLEGEVHARVGNVRRAELRFGRGRVDARLDGPLGDPHVDAIVDAEEIRLGEHAFSSAEVHADGGVHGAVVRARLSGVAAAPDVTASAAVELGRGVVLRAPEASVRSHGVSVTARAEKVEIGDGRFRADKALVGGLGAPVRADLDLGARYVSVRAASDGVDLGEVARALGRNGGPIGGRAAFDANLVATNESATGRAFADVRDLSYGNQKDGTAHVEAEIDHRRVSARLSAQLGKSYVEGVAREVRLDGPVTKASAWARAEGNVDVDVDVDLATVRALVPERLVPFGDLGGRLAAVVRLARKGRDEPPEVSVVARSDGLVVAGRSARPGRAGGGDVETASASRLTGVDFDARLSVDARGDTRIAALARDRQGTIADFTAAFEAPYRELLEDPEGNAPKLLRTPFDAKLTVPRRRLSRLPSLLSLRKLEGDGQLRVEASRTILEPEVKVEAEFDAVRRRGNQATPLDGRLVGLYDRDRGEVDVTMSYKHRPALELSSQVRAKVSDVLASGRSAPWDGWVHAKLSDFPVGLSTVLQDQRVKGTVSGELGAFAGTGLVPNIHAALESDNLRLGYELKNRLTARVDVDEQTLDASARIKQSTGFAEVRAKAGVSWSAGGLLPTVDPARAELFSLRASKFRASVLLPFLQESVRELDGVVDANVELHAGSPSSRPTLAGFAALGGGTFQLPTAGGEFQHVSARATFDPDGVVRIKDVSGEGTTGEFTGSGEIRLDGLEVKSARADFRIPKREPLPLIVEGQALAEIWGRLGLRTAKEARHLAVSVEVPDAGVRLPPKSTHDLQDLAADPHVHAGVYRAPGEFTVLPLEPPRKFVAPGARSRTKVRISDVEVQRGSDLRVRLEGELTVETGGDKPRVTGTIQLGSGFLEVQGKRFEIEKGTITFVGTSDNPEVVVTAGWTAPEGTRVYADFLGPLKTGKLTLRSDPPHTNTEILSLILFGAIGGTEAPLAPGATPIGVAGAGAMGIGGGIATQGLTRAIDDLTGLDITTRIDTSSSTNPRPEVEFRIARDISLSIAHVLGVPPPGTNPDKNYATLDWRFSRNWSIQSTFGDQGSSIVDLVWQHWY